MAEPTDTTEMCLKTVYELEEDDVPSLRVHIIERLDRLGPTVSQTVMRMERDGSTKVAEDRSLGLINEGRRRTIDVIRKHRLAERLPLNVIGIKRRSVHNKAYHWEYIMSEQVEECLADILSDASTDPFGNPVSSRTTEHPRSSADEISVDCFVGRSTVMVAISRIEESIQADAELLAGLEGAQIVTRVEVELRVSAGGVHLVGSSSDPVVLADDIARHLFVQC